MAELFSYLFTMFVYSPLQAELTEKLAGMPSREMASSVANCFKVAGPVLLDRAQNEWSWVAAQAIGINFGLIESTQVISGLSPDCERVTGLLAEKSAEE
jgi:hypothetical protein